MKRSITPFAAIAAMKNKPVPIKCAVCGLAYLIFTLLLIFVVYILGLFGAAFFLGVLYGIVIAWAAYCQTIKRTILAMFMGLLTAFAAQIALLISGIPYEIIRFILRNDEFVRETGRLTVNEVIGYNWGTMLFWFGLINSFIVSLIVILIVRIAKKQSGV